MGKECPSIGSSSYFPSWLELPLYSTWAEQQESQKISEDDNAENRQKHNTQNPLLAEGILHALALDGPREERFRLKSNASSDSAAPVPANCHLHRFFFFTLPSAVLSYRAAEMAHSLDQSTCKLFRAHFSVVLGRRLLSEASTKRTLFFIKCRVLWSRR